MPAWPLRLQHSGVQHASSAGRLPGVGRRGGGLGTPPGTTPAADKDKKLAAFRDNPRCRVALLAVQACGAGLNLNQADTVVFAELCWTPSTLEQAEARIHRMGQQVPQCQDRAATTTHFAQSHTDPHP